MPAPRPNAADPTAQFVAARAAALAAPLGDDAPLAVGVSGGADSLALALLLKAGWRGPLVALIVDHGLRPRSADEAGQVAAWLSSAGIDAHILRWSGNKPVTGIQAAARQARYALMGAWCAHRQVDLLAVAHHADDQAETQAMRRHRRSGPFGLRGMDAALALWPGDDAPRLIRPLLDVPKTALTSWLRAQGQSWIEDPSNQDRRFERARLREDGAERLRARPPDLEPAVRDLLASARCDAFGAVDWSPPHTQGEAWLLAAQLLIGQTGGATCMARRRDILSLRQRIQAEPDGAATLGGCRIRWRAGALRLVREWQRIDATQPVDCRQGFDERFDIGQALSQQQWRPLSEAGWRHLPLAVRADARARGDRLAALATPALWQGDTLVAAPILRHWTPDAPAATATLRPLRRNICPTVLSRPPLPLSLKSQAGV